MLTLAGLVAAFVAVVYLAGARGDRRRGRRRRRRPGAVPAGHDPAARRSPACWLCRRARSRHRWRAFAPAGSSHARVPATSGRWSASGVTQTEVFPLLFFAVGGMLLFPASNDLLTMFVALEVLSLPLYLLCGLARRRRLLSARRRRSSTSCSARSRRRSSSTASRCSTATPAPCGCRASPTPSSSDSGDDALLLLGTALVAVGLLFKVGAVAVPLLDAGRLPGRADPGHRLHGRLHQGRRVRRAAAGLLRRRRRPRAGTGGR